MINAIFCFLAFAAIFYQWPDVIRVGMATIWFGATIWWTTNWNTKLFFRMYKK